ncbi:N-acetylglucosaminylphosphatidylinositol deacetylase, putative [Plasmodium malariae]|uniref:N-acetylglucosaminylphosphatidylinositol deacetylase n=1 Tax=Plasmodium malariae TaxID=5858 RepID=A0A1C3KZL2_PLAMA|nr:N-acetylglucosaminylphosphatidylinositol deacetylase, putative [Plasmodium malariae]
MHCIVFANIFLMIALAYYVRHHHLDIKKDNFLNVVQEGGNISLIIAHPDDEVMFFFPTLKLLFDKKKKKELFLFSLSNGNYYGKGKIREKELFNVWSYLGGEKNNCEILDDDQIQDSWNFWDEQHLANVLTDYCSKRNIKLINDPIQIAVCPLSYAILSNFAVLYQIT